MNQGPRKRATRPVSSCCAQTMDKRKLRDKKLQRLAMVRIMVVRLRWLGRDDIKRPNAYTMDKRVVQARVASGYVRMHKTMRWRHQQGFPNAERTKRTSLTVTASSPSMSYKHVVFAHPNSERTAKTSATEMAPSALTSSGQVGGTSSSGSMTPLQLLSLPSPVPGAPGYIVLLASLQSPSKSTVPVGATAPQKYWAKYCRSRRHRCRNRLLYRGHTSHRPMWQRRRNCTLQDWCIRRMRFS